MNTRVATQKPVRSTAAIGKAAKGWTAEEKAAMRERAKEMKAAESKEEAEQAVVAKIAAMKEPDRSIAKRLHAIVKSVAPELSARLWYGSPAWAKDGDVVFFFQDREKFKTRYGNLGFSDKAHLDDGKIWPNSYALLEMTAAEEARITELIKKAVG